jgi:hypothetical protein
MASASDREVSIRDRTSPPIARIFCALLLAASLATPAAVAGRYSVAGIDDAAVTKFLSALQEAVAKDQRERVVALVAYPLRVNTGKRHTFLRTQKALLSAYDRVFNPEVRKALAAQRPEALFVNYLGVMIGDGQIWFGRQAGTSELRVQSVNTSVAKKK